MEARRFALDDRNVSTVVVEAVADTRDVSPVELEPPLYDAVDPDALNDLAERASAAETARVSFTYAGYEITVSGGEEVVVRPETATPPSHSRHSSASTPK